MRPKSFLLSGPQLDIMKIVWRHGEATVRDVYEDLRLQRPVAYTTVMTTMKTMEARGHLKKRVEGRAYVYEAVVPESRMIRRLVGDFLDRVFNGSAEPLLAHLVKERRVSERDLEQVSRMIREKERH
jgi:BlaI family transcriptional regulator, penicillinase repressor